MVVGTVNKMVILGELLATWTIFEHTVLHHDQLPWLLHIVEPGYKLMLDASTNNQLPSSCHQNLQLYSPRPFFMRRLADGGPAWWSCLGVNWRGLRNFTNWHPKIDGPWKCIETASKMASFWVSMSNFRGVAFCWSSCSAVFCSCVKQSPGIATTESRSCVSITCSHWLAHLPKEGS